MARNLKAAVREVERLLKEGYGKVFDDLEGLDPETVERDIANGEEPQAIVSQIAVNFCLAGPTPSARDRALRIAMVGKRQEFDGNGRKQDPHGGAGITPPDNDAFGIPRNALSFADRQAPVQDIDSECFGESLGDLNEVKRAYDDGICPDCGEEIPDDVAEGDACKNCRYVFNRIHEDSISAEENERINGDDLKGKNADDPDRRA